MLREGTIQVPPRTELTSIEALVKSTHLTAPCIMTALFSNIARLGRPGTGGEEQDHEEDDRSRASREQERAAAQKERKEVIAAAEQQRQ